VAGYYAILSVETWIRTGAIFSDLCFSVQFVMGLGKISKINEDIKLMYHAIKIYFQKLTFRLAG